MAKNCCLSPSYLVRQAHSYCFRLIIPRPLRLAFGLTELRYTLHTGSLSEAKFRARTIAAYVQGLIREVKGNGPRTQLFAPEQLQGHIRDFIANCLEIWGLRLTKSEGSDEAWVGELIRSIVTKSEENRGDIPIHTTFAPKPRTLLTTIIADYSVEKINARKWSEKTHLETHACLNMFLHFAGNDIAVEDISAKLVREYKAALQRLPTQADKNTIYRGKSAQEVFQLKSIKRTCKTLGIGTINKYLSRLSTLLAYAVNNGYITFNPASGMQLEERKNDDEFRSAFSKDELYKLFHSNQYVDDTFICSFQFWTPLIALFTGARQNEVAQLHLEDIRQEDGVWVFDINQKPGKKLKTKAAARLIPIHPFLLDLGLARYASELRVRGESRLFPELPPKRDGHGQMVSRWFNGNINQPGYRRKCGVHPGPGEPKKDYHSFRHTFIDHLVKKRVPLTLLHKLDGHKFGSMTLDRYSKGKSLVHAMLEEVIIHADFHLTIPLVHLIHSRFARPIQTARDGNKLGDDGWTNW